MTRLLGTSALAALALGLSACASGGSGGTPEPIIDAATGDIAPPRNLVLEETSFMSGADHRGVDETYDIAVRTLNVDRSGNGAETFSGTSLSNFGTGQTMSYDADTNQFSLDIDYAVDDTADSARIVMNETFGPLLLVTPKRLEGLENGLPAVYLAAQPLFYGGAIPDFAGDVDAADAFLTDLSDRADAGDDSAADLRDFIQLRTAEIEAGPNFLYRTDDVVYFQYRTDGNVAKTRFVAAAEWQQTNADGSEEYGHLVFGQRTDPNEMPRTGTASYDGTIYGNINRQNTVSGLRGGFTMETDFATGDIDMTMDANIAYRNGEGVTEFIDYAEFEGTGNIDDASFAGTMEGTLDRDVPDGTETELLVGSFEGAFFGPTAQEAGGTFEFTGDNAAAAGAFVAGDPNSNITGD